MYLLERGVRVTGTDAWSWDAPFSYTAERYAWDRDASIIWEGHKAGRDLGYCHLEKCTTWKPCQTPALPSAVFPTRFGGICGLDPGGRHY